MVFGTRSKNVSKENKNKSIYKNALFFVKVLEKGRGMERGNKK